MRNFYLVCNFFLFQRSLVRYFLIFYYSILHCFTSGFICKPRSLYIVIDHNVLNLILIFLRFNMISNLRLLTDIIVVDNFDLINNRFELTYSF